MLTKLFWLLYLKNHRLYIEFCKKNDSPYRTVRFFKNVIIQLHKEAKPFLLLS